MVRGGGHHYRAGSDSSQSHASYDYSSSYYQPSPAAPVSKTMLPPALAAPTGPKAVGNMNYYDDDDQKQQQQQHDHHNDMVKERSTDVCSWLCKCCCCCCCCCHHGQFLRFLPWMVVTVVYWAVLWIMASSYSPGNHQFTLNVGETWQVIPPSNLWSRTALQIYSATVNPGVEVYQFMPLLDYSSQQQGQVTCPPLQGGPVLTLHEPTSHVIMDMDEYQYDYFHLNQGSVLSVDARLQSLTSGATNLYLLQGYHALASLQEHDSIQDFRGNSILKRFLGQGGSTVMEYTVPTSDYYIVVYDNAAAGVTKLDVAITVQMATHLLPDGQQPICTAQDTALTASEGGSGCRWLMTNNADRQRIAGMCLIVKAVSTKLEKAEERQRKHGPIAPPPPGEGPPGGDPGPPPPPLDLDDVEVVIVQVDAPLGSLILILLTVLPLVVVAGGWLMNHGTKCCAERHQNKLDAMNRSLRTTTTTADVLDDRLVILRPAEERTPLTGRPASSSSYYSSDDNTGSNRRIFPMPRPMMAKGAMLVRNDTPEIRTDGLIPVRPPQ